MASVPVASVDVPSREENVEDVECMGLPCRLHTLYKLKQLYELRHLRKLLQFSHTSSETLSPAWYNLAGLHSHSVGLLGSNPWILGQILFGTRIVELFDNGRTIY